MMTLKLRNNLFHFVYDSHIIEPFGEFVQFYLVLEGEIIRIFSYLGKHDLGMNRCFCIFFSGNEFFIEFLTIAKTSEFYLDILGSRGLCCLVTGS